MNVFLKNHSTMKAALFVSLLALIILAPACSSKKKINQSAAASSAGAIPADFQLIVGTSGGFAGRMNGYTIEANGAVTQWEGKYPGENVTQTGQLNAEEMAELWHEMEEAAYFDYQQQEAGNMTTFMNARADGKTHRVTWPRQLGEVPAGSKMQVLHAACMEIIAQGFDDDM